MLDKVVTVVGLQSVIWGLEEVGKSSAELHVELWEVLSLVHTIPAVKELEKAVQAGSKAKPAQATESGETEGPTLHHWTCSSTVAVVVQATQPSNTHTTV